MSKQKPWRNLTAGALLAQLRFSCLHILVLYVLASLRAAEKLITENSDVYKMGLGTKCQEQCYSVEEKLHKKYVPFWEIYYGCIAANVLQNTEYANCFSEMHYC